MNLISSNLKDLLLYMMRLINEENYYFVLHEDKYFGNVFGTCSLGFYTKTIIKWYKIMY
jgi:hypothetical protein